ncbi:hypothetical protein [Streptomyces sp. NPDC054838]
MSTRPRDTPPDERELGPGHAEECGSWFRCYWDEEDTWFCFEVDAEGWVVRQVELQGPELRPIAAARDTDHDGRYGFTAERPVSDWEGHGPEPLTAERFEEVWDAARSYLAAGAGPT